VHVSGSAPTNLRERIGNFPHLGRCIPSGKCYHRRNLEKAHLKRVRRSNFHAAGNESRASGKPYTECVPQGNIAVQSKRYCVHELRRVGHKSKQRNTQEFLINAGTLEDNVDDIDEYL
jgi:hypothetical protein